MNLTDAQLVHYDRAHALVTLALEQQADTIVHMAQQLIDLKLDELGYLAVALASTCATIIGIHADHIDDEAVEFWRDILTDFATRRNVP